MCASIHSVLYVGLNCDIFEVLEENFKPLVEAS